MSKRVTVSYQQASTHEWVTSKWRQKLASMQCEAEERKREMDTCYYSSTNKAISNFLFATERKRLVVVLKNHLN